MPTPALTEPIPAEAERLWREIAGHVREACILRREGRHLAAAEILERTLPPMIRAWAGECTLPAAEAKARLNRLFNEEQARVESHWLMARFLSEDSTAAHTVRQLSAYPAVPVAPSPAAMWCPPIAPRRIPLDAVVEMIDAARDLERCAAQRAHSPSL